MRVLGGGGGGTGYKVDHTLTPAIARFLSPLLFENSLHFFVCLLENSFHLFFGQTLLQL